MTISFNTLRKEFKGFFHAVGNSDSFRPTGDCSIHEITRNAE